MLSTLPYDIWCLVAKYLPESELLQLYTVNAAFFDLAMNRQYREVLIDYCEDNHLRSRPLFMGPVVLKRVHSLVLYPLSYANAKPSQLKRKIEKLKKFLHLPKWSFRSPNLAEFQAESQERIEQMSQLTSLTIGRYPHDYLEKFVSIGPLIQTTWIAHGDRLTSLTLSIPLEAFAICRPIPSLHALTELNFRLYLEYNTTFYEDILVSLAGFIGHHSSSLTSLSIDTPSSSIDPLHLFSNIPHLPHLKKLSLIIWLERLRPAYYTQVDRFLEKHATALTDFKLHFWGPNTFDALPAPEIFFADAIFKVELPSLKSLDLGLCRWEEELSQSVKEYLTRYLRRVQPTLIRLSIEDYILTHSQVQGIVGVFGGGNSQLESLQIHKYFLSYSMLDLLYEQLPKLRSLGLRFDALLIQDDGLWNVQNYHWGGYDNHEAAFVKHMEGRDYHDWSLRDFTIRPLYYPPDSERWTKCRTALAAALPPAISLRVGPDTQRIV